MGTETQGQDFRTETQGQGPREYIIVKSLQAAYDVWSFVPTPLGAKENKSDLIW